MKKRTPLSRVLSLFFALLLLLGMIPFSAMDAYAAPASDIPANMLDNYPLRALEYLGFNVQGMKNDGKIYKLWGGQAAKYMTTGIPGPTDTSGAGCSGLEKWADNTHGTGYVPDVEQFRYGGMMCAAFVNYYIHNYMRYVEGIDFPLLRARVNQAMADGGHIRVVKFWYDLLEELHTEYVAGTSDIAQRIYSASFYQNVDPTAADFAKMEIGDIIVFGSTQTADNGSTIPYYIHIAIYAGAYGGEYFIIHNSNSAGKGPGFGTVSEMSYGESGKDRAHVVGVYRLNEAPKGGVPVSTFNEGLVEVYKKDPNGNALAGASFTVSNTATNEQILLGPTDQNGYAILSEKIPYGTYKVVEAKFPEGYTSSGTSEWTVTLDENTPNGTVTINAVNQRIPGSVSIQKNTSDGNNKAGWLFSFYADQSCASLISGPHASGADGSVTIPNLPAGNVWVKEVGHQDASIAALYSCTSTNPQQVTVPSGGTASVTFDNTLLTGNILLQKNTNTGSNKGGWKVDLYDGNRIHLGTHTIPDAGTLTISGLVPGTYYLKEQGSSDPYWVCDTEEKTAVVTPNGTTTVTFTNIHQGSITLQKDTNTGVNKGGWKVDLYDSNRNHLGTHTIPESGTLTISGLLPGTYYLKEQGSADPYWVCDTEEKAAAVTAGADTKVTFTNIHKGSITLQKDTNTGVNKGGWKIDLYDGNRTYMDTYTIPDSGILTISGLLPGTYYLKEQGSSDPYWVCDTEEKAAAVTAGADTKVTFTNTHKGSITLQKDTNTGANKGGWKIDLYDSNRNHLGTHTIPDSGTLTISGLMPGTYYLKEQGSSDPYWVCDTEEKTAAVTAGKDTKVTFTNTHRGIARVKKDTNTSVDLDGWQYGLYSDESCTSLVGTLTTDDSGDAWIYAAPGTYWMKEIGDTQGRWSSEYWTCDTQPKIIEVVAGEDKSVTFLNIHYGKGRILKDLVTDGPLEGWQFKVTRLSDNTDMGILTTGEDGTILSEKWLPGEYLIEEIFPEDSLYYCKSENPVTITVKEGETTEVTFTNALRPGQIILEKVNFLGEHLAGAKFLLEWSEDGTNWTPVVFSSSEDVVKGGCTSEGLADGCLVTDETGIIIFEGLYPSLQYRVTETEAPEGYILLSEAAYVGGLPVEDLTVTKTVHNSHGYTIPSVGGPGFIAVTTGTVLGVLALMINMISVFCGKKRRK